MILHVNVHLIKKKYICDTAAAWTTSPANKKAECEIMFQKNLGFRRKKKRVEIWLAVQLCEQCKTKNNCYLRWQAVFE